MKKLPIGIQTFSEIISENYVYVDKTKWIHNLMDVGKYIFLSRPRRFGKSLLVSTLDSLFRGRKELFSGLYIEDKIEWKEHPVIRLDLSTCQADSVQNLETSLRESLQFIAEEYSVSLESALASGRFKELIRKLSSKGRVVILIDEYDKPIVDSLTNPDLLAQMKDILKNFYSILKGSDEFIKFVFITGVSKFSQVSVFSGLNNIKDISFFPEFASLLGYTQEELESCFSEWYPLMEKKTGLAKQDILDRLRHWYNGYSWDGENRVYNPYSILNFFDRGEFRNFWFETGTPSFLIRHIITEKIQVPSVENMEVAPEAFSAFGINEISFHSLLLQTGYLTVKEIRRQDTEIKYILDYPNEEVRRSFFFHILNSFLDGSRVIGDVNPIVWDMNSALRQNDVKSFMLKLHSLFASIPYTLHMNAEAYYHSLFYLVLKLIGCRIDPVGQHINAALDCLDGILEFPDRVYVIELKLGSPQKAMEQIHDRKYHAPYLGSGKKIYLLGIGYLNRETDYLLEELN